MTRIGYWKHLGLSLVAGMLPYLAAAAPIALATDFNRDIRPLFAKHCTVCHGGVKRAGQLSFLYRDQALAEGKSGRGAIIPAEPDNSEVIRRVTTTDPEELMPKADHGPRLTDAEVATLRRWIREGAIWGEHWSFVPPKEPARPKLRNLAATPEQAAIVLVANTLLNLDSSLTR